MKATVIHCGALMPLARRGGPPGHPIIDPEKVDGYVHAIRAKNTSYVDGDDSNSQFANAGQHCNSTISFPPINGVRSVDKCIDFPVLTCEPSLEERPAGSSADASLTSGIIGQVGDPGWRQSVKRGESPVPNDESISGNPLPLKARVGNPVEFPASLGIAPCDLHFSDCAAAEDPLRNLPNASGEWIHSIIEPRKFNPTNVQLSPDKLDVEEFWKSLPFNIPDRITPFLLHSMLKTNNLERWHALTRALGTLEEYGSTRDKGMIGSV